MSECQRRHTAFLSFRTYMDQFRSASVVAFLGVESSLISGDSLKSRSLLSNTDESWSFEFALTLFETRLEDFACLRSRGSLQESTIPWQSL